MKIIHYNITKKFPVIQPYAACIGYFDGFHAGHMALVDTTLEIAHKKNIKSAVITFDPDPWVVLKHIEHPVHLTTMNDRMEIAREKGIDYWIAIHFDQHLAEQPHEVFTDMLAKTPLVSLVSGFDFTYGYKGSGNSQTLKQEGQGRFDVIEILPINDDGVKISTTRIGMLIDEGKIGDANRLLGRIYAISGTIVGGRRIGRKMGFPTANLAVDSEYRIPRIGVYAGRVEVEGVWYEAMISIGKNPTVTEETNISVEAHLFDFDREIYGMSVKFEFHQYMRDEIKFANIEDLVSTIREDEVACRAYFHGNR
ncbi:MAG: riboflavin biosynthesis protein RibF [Erysipelotrichaceae bacterium]